MLESAAAGAYWLGWQKVSITFSAKNLARVPEHWKSFPARGSLISGSPRLACDPINAMLNYLYALLEAVTRLANRLAWTRSRLGILAPRLAIAG